MTSRTCKRHHRLLSGLKERRYTVSVVCLSFEICPLPGEGDSVKCWVGVCHRDAETLTLSAAHTHTAHTVGVQPQACIFLRVLHKLKFVYDYQISIRLCKLDRVYKTLLVT